MTASNPWASLFPVADARVVVSHVIQTWTWAISARRAHFQFAHDEPKITQYLASLLNARKDVSGLTGRWSCEDLKLHLAPDGQRLGKRRADITYFSDRCQPILYLIFEFKKLTQKRRTASLKAYCGSEGMGRFVCGAYGAEEPVGLMVGILEKPDHTFQVSLADMLEDPTRVRDLSAILDGTGKAVRAPSALFPADALFDTQHSRSSQDMTLAHLILAFA